MHLELILDDLSILLLFLFSRLLLNEAVTTKKVRFFRIDVSSNDLPWQFQMDTLPAVLFFPAGRSVLFYIRIVGQNFHKILLKVR